MQAEQRTFWDYGDSLQAAYEVWRRQNPHIYAAFKRSALALKTAGRKRYGAKAIAEHMRYHQAMQSQGDPWKINNNFVSRMARELLAEMPEEFEGFLELRKLQRD